MRITSFGKPEGEEAHLPPKGIYRMNEKGTGNINITRIAKKVKKQLRNTKNINITRKSSNSKIVQLGKKTKQHQTIHFHSPQHTNPVSVYFLPLVGFTVSVRFMRACCMLDKGRTSIIL